MTATASQGSSINASDVIAHLLPPARLLPNNPHCALLVYPGAVKLGGADPASLFEALFAANLWTHSWRNGIFPFHHYHSSAHEVLGIYSGEASVQFGGADGVSLDVQPGDVVVVPAGVGHKKLSSKGMLGIVGAYADGQHADLCVPDSTDVRSASDNVARVPRPQNDPVLGADGPLLKHWPAA
jgi:uncharacterized protein YjlB